jgi:hypothetical protein
MRARIQRMSKKAKYILSVLVGIVLMAATVPLAIWITHTSSAGLGNDRARCRRDEHAAHRVIIRNDKVSPAHTEAHKCDSLAIVNLDDKQRLMAFGRHEDHISYDGVSERLLSKGQELKVTLISKGTYLFHDHAQAAVQGTFTVN